MISDSDQRQEREWTSLYRRIVRLLSRYGRNGFKAADDFFVVDENIASNQQKVELTNLALLRPGIVIELQRLLRDYSGWEIVIGVSARDATGESRDMGLIVRRHEIIDGLQRQYLPEPYRNIRYESSRPGTEFD